MKLGHYIAGAALIGALAAPSFAETPVVPYTEPAPLNLDAVLVNEKLDYSKPVSVDVSVYASDVNPKVLNDALGRLADFYRQFNIDMKFEQCDEPLEIEYPEDDVKRFNVDILPDDEYELFAEKLDERRSEYRGDNTEHISFGDASGYAQFKTIIVNIDHQRGEGLGVFSDAGDENLEPAYLARTLIHEFGHVVGLIHTDTDFKEIEFHQSKR